MVCSRWWCVVGFALLVPMCQAVRAEDARHRAPQCLAVDNYFAEEVWAKVGERSCLNCHRAALRMRAENAGGLHPVRLITGDYVYSDSASVVKGERDYGFDEKAFDCTCGCG